MRHETLFTLLRAHEYPAVSGMSPQRRMARFPIIGFGRWERQMGDGQDVVRIEASSTPVDADRDTVAARSAVTPAVPAGVTWPAPLGLSLVGWIVVVSLAVGVALRVWPLSGVSLDYDEGVYWQSLRAMSQGHALFSSVFSSQPPLFLWTVYPFYLLFGQSLVAARLGVAVYSLIGLGAAYAAARMLGGRVAAAVVLVLLALDPLFVQESRTLQAEAPALAFELAAVALAMLAARRAGSARLWLAAASGLVLALGTGVKLFDVVGVVPVALYLLSPVGPALLDAQGRPSWPGADPVLRALRVAAPSLLACAAGILLGAAAVALPFVGQWPALYDQVVRFHLAAAHASNQGLRANVRTVAGVWRELPLEAFALAAFVLGLARRRWVVVPPALWAGASLLFLLTQHPLLPHHMALLVPPLALTVAVAVPALFDAAPRQDRVPSSSGPRDASAILASVWSVWAFVALVAAWSVGTAFVQARAAAAAPVSQSAVASALARVTAPGDLVVADDQYVAGLANRDVPPSLVDTSQVRIASGYLTAAQLEQAVQQTDVRAVLFYSGRFNLVPGFRAWVAQHYTLVGSFGNGTALYVKIPPGPQVA